ncbi:hypothetical protein CMI37_31810 [Candidatus Pacearchaeota archaeon]|nr:hypothetical protein [Candidatus Pacearchaeota archaeon]|tara:strand:- start:454 stop:726 length:273 start_codon:yes stop_codon:yes gene_type:complete
MEVSPRSKRSGTRCTWEIRKPHPGLIQFVVVFPDDDFYIWREIEFHDTEKITQNIGCTGELPENWLQETQRQREDRLDLQEEDDGSVRET